MNDCRRKPILWAMALALLIGPGALTARASFATLDAGVTNLAMNEFLNGGTGAIPTWAVNTSVLESAFDFSPTTAGADGKVVSQVYFNAAAGLFAYLYQVQILPTAEIGSSDRVTNFNINWKRSIFEDALFTGIGTAPVFEITSLGTATDDPGGFLFLNPPPSTALVQASSIEGTDYIDLGVNYAGSRLMKVAGGISSSAIVVVFSKIKPTIEPIASMADSGATFPAPGSPFPEVYTPAPEPAAMVLWGLGGIGFGLGSYLYDRRKRRGRLALA